jgi:NADH dehydrogenase FAD-containing subunit
METSEVLIVGGGFGGAEVARHLERLLPGPGRGRGGLPGDAPSVQLVTPENFLLFAPLLPEAR